MSLASPEKTNIAPRHQRMAATAIGGRADRAIREYADAGQKQREHAEEWRIVEEPQDHAFSAVRLDNGAIKATKVRPTPERAPE